MKPEIKTSLHPGNIYSVHSTEDDADLFSIGDVEPMIEVCVVFKWDGIK